MKLDYKWTFMERTIDLLIDLFDDVQSCHLDVCFHRFRQKIL